MAKPEVPDPLERVPPGIGAELPHPDWTEDGIGEL